jgi:hypothetical protein
LPWAASLRQFGRREAERKIHAQRLHRHRERSTVRSLRRN